MSVRLTTALKGAEHTVTAFAQRTNESQYPGLSTMQQIKSQGVHAFELLLHRGSWCEQSGDPKTGASVPLRKPPSGAFKAPASGGITKLVLG